MLMHSAKGFIYYMFIIKQIAPFLAGLHSIPYLQMRSTLDLEILHRAAIVRHDQLSSSRKKVATALRLVNSGGVGGVTPPNAWKILQ